MNDIRFERYYFGEKPGQLVDALLDPATGPVLSNRPATEQCAPYLLRTVDPASLNEFSPLRAWLEEAANWVPAPLQEWWDEQRQRQPDLESRPLEWWSTQANAAVGAWYGTRPIGAIALANVTWGDRPHFNDAAEWLTDDLFQEIRSWVVDEDFQKQGVGTHLLQEILAVAERSHLETIAITSNPEAAAMFARNGAEDATKIPRSNSYPIPPKLACWGSRDLSVERCDICPMRPDRMWAWPVGTKTVK